MKKWLADLHVHTLLSPCAEIEMTPHHIVMKAAESGVNLLAITDHNASANIVALRSKGFAWHGSTVQRRSTYNCTF